jgi:hypothetical protein
VLESGIRGLAYLLHCSLTQAQHLHWLLSNCCSPTKMFDHDLRPQPQSIIWNHMTASSCFSSQSSGHTSLETHSLGNQFRDSDTSTSPYAGGSDSGSSTPGNIFSTSSAVQSISEANCQPRKRKRVACGSCRQRKTKCEGNKNVQRQRQQGRSAPLTHDQCQNAPYVPKPKLQEELDATKLALFREKEKSKVMSAEIARLKEVKQELLERLGHPSVRVSGCCVDLVHSNDLTPHQATSYM